MERNDLSFWHYEVYSQDFPGEGASNDCGVVENVDVQSFRTPHLRNLNKANVIVVQYYLVPRRLSTDRKYVTLNGHFTLNSVFLL